MIKSVKGLSIGDLFDHEGNTFEVTSFPTRSMVCADLIHTFTYDAPGNIKITRSSIRTRDLRWVSDRPGICDKLTKLG